MNEAELLFSQVLDCDRISLYRNRGLRLDSGQKTLIAATLKRRIKGEPVQYILGKADFMGLEFKVNTDVLIPRPETEILVEEAVKKLSTAQFRPAGIKILDLGSGSGCIAISLAKYLPDAKITATDISRAALAIAKENAGLNNVLDKITFLHSDLFASSRLRALSYELIICNPPYIATTEIGTLQPEIAYEPRIALDGGKDGLFFYRRIIKESSRYLKDRGLLFLEMGFQQAEAIKNIFQNSADFAIIDVIRDYNNIERVIIAKKEIKNG